MKNAFLVEKKFFKCAAKKNYSEKIAYNLKSDIKCLQYINRETMIQ